MTDLLLRRTVGTHTQPRDRLSVTFLRLNCTVNWPEGDIVLDRAVCFFCWTTEYCTTDGSAAMASSRHRTTDFKSNDQVTAWQIQHTFRPSNTPHKYSRPED